MIEIVIGLLMIISMFLLAKKNNVAFIIIMLAQVMGMILYFNQHEYECCVVSVGMMFASLWAYLEWKSKP